VRLEPDLELVLELTLALFLLRACAGASPAIEAPSKKEKQITAANALVK